MSKKNKIIIGSAVLLVLLLIMAFLMIKAGTQKLSTKDDPYSFSVAERKKGAIVGIKGDFPEGYRWTAAADENLCRVTTRKEQKNNVSFLVKGVQADSAFSVRFLLMKEGILPDIRYMLTYQFITDANGRTNFHAVLKQAFPAPTEYAAGTDHAFTAAMTEAGSLILALTGDSEEAWSIFSEDETLLGTESLGADAGKQYLHIYPQSYDFKTVLYLIREADGLIQPLKFSADLTGRLMLSADDTISAISAEEAAKMVKEAGYDPERLGNYISSRDLRILLSSGKEEALAAWLEAHGIRREQVDMGPAEREPLSEEEEAAVQAALKEIVKNGLTDDAVAKIRQYYADHFGRELSEELATAIGRNLMKEP